MDSRIDMMEAVLPISDREAVRRNLDRAELLLRSLRFFWSGNSPLRLHVVAPDEEVDKIRQRLQPFATDRLQLDFLPESTVSPNLALGGSGKGIAKQMLVKMAAFQFVKTKFYLTLDTDVVACRPLSTRDLVLGGKALTEWAQPTTLAWWQESATVLGYDAAPSTFAARARIHITPQVMSSEISRLLSDYLSLRFNADWLMGLLDRYTGNHPHIWTEYTLYDLFADMQGLLPRFYWMPEELPGTWRLHGRQNIWMPDDYRRWRPEQALEDATIGYFLVFQSILAHDVDFDHVSARWSAAVKARYPSYEH